MTQTGDIHGLQLHYSSANDTILLWVWSGSSLQSVLNCNRNINFLAPYHISPYFIY